jgi:hypothetical protein
MSLPLLRITVFYLIKAPYAIKYISHQSASQAPQGDGFSDFAG